MVAPALVEAVADDGWADAWRAAAHEVQAAWSDDGSLSRIVRLPWAELPGGPTLAMYTSEVTTHTWDLATATGQQPAWDDDVVGVALAAARRGLPAENRAEILQEVLDKVPLEHRSAEPPFAEAVAVAPGAPLIDQLVAWNGRRP